MKFTSMLFAALLSVFVANEARAQNCSGLTGTVVTANSNTGASAPVVDSSFAPTDANVYVASLLTGAIPTETMTLKFYAPDTTLFQTVNLPVSTSLGSSVSKCVRRFWYAWALSGQSQASMPGTWTVELRRASGTLVASTTFTVECPAGVTYTLGSALSNTGGSAFTPVSDFYSNDASAYFAIDAVGTIPTETLSFAYFTPGSYTWQTGTTSISPSGGYSTGTCSRRFWLNVFPISGTLITQNQLYGTWLLEIRDGFGSLKDDHAFTISQ